MTECIYVRLWWPGAYIDGGLGWQRVWEGRQAVYPRTALVCLYVFIWDRLGESGGNYGGGGQ